MLVPLDVSDLRLELDTALRFIYRAAPFGSKVNKGL